MKAKPKVIRQRRRKETNAERKVRRRRIDEERRRLFNELKKTMFEEASAKTEEKVEVSDVPAEVEAPVKETI